MKPSKETKKTYKKILISSLYKDFSLYEHKFQRSGYTTTYFNYLMIDYNTVVIKIHKRAIFDKVQIINKASGDYFHFLTIFNFWFDKNLRLGYYTILKKYIRDIKEKKIIETNRQANEDFINSLPISLLRMEKIKEILDL